MKVEVSPTEIEEREADNRGRITLGADYADKTVTIAVLEEEKED